MALLRRVLYLDALREAVVGVALLGFPGTLLIELFDQPPYGDYAFVRILGLASLVLAMLMVLVGHRVQEVWWWSWAFVVLEVGRAGLASLNALIGLPPGAGALVWWLNAGVSWLFAAGFLWGLARAGAEKPPP
ncbi:MAG TPA: hypothetical protein VG602_03985 [Actinomycetota bacterium]|nr:hypothetical protein [Actinomycetota bacterium]